MYSIKNSAPRIERIIAVITRGSDECRFQEFRNYVHDNYVEVNKQMGHAA